MAVSERTVMNIKDAEVRFADDEASLTTTATEFQCVVTSAAITTSPSMQTVPATGCTGESQSPAASSFALTLGWLQDWAAADGGLSKYAWDHDTELKWFSLSPKKTGLVIATGRIYVVAGPFLGDFGTVLVATGITWPCFDKPDITIA
jgi:hypothetical protein